MLHYSTFYYIESCYIILHSIILYHIELCYIKLHFMILYHILLYHFIIAKGSNPISLCVGCW